VPIYIAYTALIWHFSASYDLDIHLAGRWRPCATIEPLATANTRRGPVRLRYEIDYATDYPNARDIHALTVRAPVDLRLLSLPHWPSFLIDLLPQGAARRRIERNADQALTEWALLERGAINPVGNLRIRPNTERIQPPHP